MTSIANLEALSSVRTKLNYILAIQWQTRAALLAGWSNGLIPDGLVVSDGTSLYKAVAGATSISDLTGLVPFQENTPNHYKENTTPGTTDMTAAFQAAVNYGTICDVTLLGETYLISSTITVTSRVDSAAVEPAFIRGKGRGLSIVVNSAPANDWIKFQKGFGNDSGWIAPFVSDLSLNASGTSNTQSNTGAALKLVRCINGVIERVGSNGATHHFYCENVGQMTWDKCIIQNSNRADNALSTWTMTTNDTDAPTGSPRCFGNYVIGCEQYNGNDVEKTFDLRVTDGLHVNNCHLNNSVYRFYIRPDNTNYRDTVKDVEVSNCYFDGNGSPVSFMYAEATAGTGTARIEAILVDNCKIRVGSGNVLKLAETAAGVAGLAVFQNVKFSNCHFRQFDGRYVNITNSNITSVNIISDIQFIGNTFEDGPSGGAGASGNLNAIALEGQNLRVIGNDFTGDWQDIGEAVILVKQDTAGWLITGNTFNVPRASPISVNASAGYGDHYGNIYDGAPQVMRIVAEGSNANGTYREYMDGRLVCKKTVAFSATAITTAYGGLYRSGSLSLGDWASAFSAEPDAFLSLEYTGTFAGHGGFVAAPSATAAGNTFVFAPSSIASGSFSVNVYAEGTAA